MMYYVSVVFVVGSFGVLVGGGGGYTGITTTNVKLITSEETTISFYFSWPMQFTV